MQYLIWRLYKSFEGEILAIPGRGIAFFGLILFSLMYFFPINPYVLRIFIFVNIYAIYAASWDLLFFTGQISLGHGAFFGVAAYTAAIMNLKLGMPFPLTILPGTIAGIIIGLIAGIPALRLRGPYLAIVTLAFPIILSGAVLSFPNITGGEIGISGISPISGSRISSYYICFLVMVVSALVMWKLTDIGSTIVRTGIIFKAIREDEIAARTTGINTTKYKLIAFCISGFFAGVAGVLYAHSMKVVGLSTFEILFTIYPLIWSIFGGAATISGPVIGTYILYIFSEMLLTTIPGARMVIFSALIVVMLLFMPEGVSLWVRDKIEIMCPRCKIINAVTRKNCRVCNAPLRLE